MQAGDTSLSEKINKIAIFLHNVGPLSEMVEKVLVYTTPNVFVQSFY